MVEIQDKQTTLSQEAIEISSLAGSDELFSAQELQESVTIYKREVIVRIVNSIAETLDSPAMILLIALQAGFTRKQHMDFSRRNTPWVSPVIRSSKEPENLILRIGRFAVAESRRYLAMTPEQASRLSDAEKEYATGMIEATQYLLSCATIAVGLERSEDGVDLWGLDNMKKDVTNDERDGGEENPEQPNLRRVLREVVEGGRERFDAIAEATDLIPGRMIQLLANRAVTPQMSEDMQRFLQVWFSRRELAELTVRVREKQIAVLEQYGADVDLFYQLNWLPIGGRLDRVLAEHNERAREDLGVLIPYFTGVDIADLQERNLTYFDIYQLSRRQAAVVDAVIQSREDPYKEPYEGVAQAIERTKSNIEFVESIIPFTRVVSENAMVDLSASKYGDARAIQIWLYRVSDGTGQKELVRLSHQDTVNKSSAETIRTYVHEICGHAAQLEINDRMIREGAEGATYEKTAAASAGSRAEFFAVVLQAGISGLGKDNDSTEIPQLAPYKGKVNLPQAARSVMDAFSKPRQNPFGWITYITSKVIENIRSSTGKSVDETGRMDFLIDFMQSVTAERYERLFGEFSNGRALRFFVRNLGELVDGAWYLGIQEPNPFIIQADEGVQEEVAEVTEKAPEESEKVDYQAQALEVLSKKFGDEWIRNRDARMIFYSLMMYAVHNPNMSTWITYLEDCTADQAKEELAKIGITEDQI